ncbi:MAG: short-chain dehydrogenase/reductase [Frankiales bacterium]|nr:short-chain dehydrogenase/reductase [Frankiales bacterium]
MALLDGSLVGKVALVTGASRGLGAAIAGRLAMEGAAVAVSARTLDPDPRYAGTLQDTVLAIEKIGGTAKAFQSDLSKSDQRQALVADVTRELGPIDILVNNAAVTFFYPLQDFPLKRLDLMLEVQVRAPFELTQLVLPGMYERGGGVILNISSRAAEHPGQPPYDPVFTKGFTAYGACKAALERLTTAIAAEGYEHGVRANTLAPLDNVATPGAGAHDLVSDFALEDPSVIAEAALALVEGELTGLNALSQTLVAELGRTPQPLPEGLVTT